jgi:hypothetical protein
VLVANVVGTLVAAVDVPGAVTISTELMVPTGGEADDREAEDADVLAPCKLAVASFRMPMRAAGVELSGHDVNSCVVVPLVRDAVAEVSVSAAAPAVTPGSPG